MQGQKVLVIGMGKSGRSAFDFLERLGATPVPYDQNAELHYPCPESFDEFDMAVLSPGVPYSDRAFQGVRSRGVPYIGEAELAFRYLENPIVGITGTNGKTTVTLMISHVLNKCGILAHSLGNNGEPLTAFAKNPQEGVVVAELSSYQLDSMHQKCLDGGLVLNISEDHLDRYGLFSKYKESKLRIKEFIKDQGVFYTHPSLSSEVGSDYTRFQDLLHIPSPFTFEEENKMAAFSLCQLFGVSGEEFNAALLDFKKPRHRLSFVKELKGVRYYNDSKGTNIDATLKAVQSLNGPIFLIAGGLDKKGEFSNWRVPFEEKVAGILLIGDAASTIQKELSQFFPCYMCKTLENAVEKAYAIAKNGDTVLLSPGCASWDQFKDYAHRGEVFEELLNRIY